MNIPIDSLIEAQKYLEQAYVYEEKGELGNALRECEVALQLAPDLAEVHNLCGLILEQLNHEEEAIAAYREAVRCDPSFQEAKANLQEIEAEIQIRRNEEEKEDRQVAGFRRRALAACIDILVLMLPCLGLGWFVFRDFAFSLGPWGRLIGVVWMVPYYALFNSALGRGQTIGKKLLRIVTVDHSGSYLKPGPAIGRAVILTFVVLSRDWAIPLFRIPLIAAAVDALFWGLLFALLIPCRSHHDVLMARFKVSECG